MSVLLSTLKLTKRFGGVLATDSLSLEIAANELHAIIGPNGAGKTTLVAQLAGELKPTSGTIRFAGEDVTRLPAQTRALKGLARSFQITAICREFSALENVMLAVQAKAGHSFRFWRPARRDPALVDAATETLWRVGLSAVAGTSAGTLAHGEQRQLELAMALASRPRMLLLDEPMAGMGIEESARMLNLLSDLKQDYTILLIEHDMDAVFRLADRITVLVSGRAIATGTPEAIRNDPAVRMAYLGEEAA